MATISDSYNPDLYTPPHPPPPPPRFGKVRLIWGKIMWITNSHLIWIQSSFNFSVAIRPLDSWTGMWGGGMDSQYKLLSELLSDQAAFITSPKTSLANYWGALPPCPLSPCPPVSTDLVAMLICLEIQLLLWLQITCPKVDSKGLNNSETDVRNSLQRNRSRNHKKSSYGNRVTAVIINFLC